VKRRAAGTAVFAALALLGASCGGCAACSSPPAEPDAGVLLPPAPKPTRITRTTDLRNASLLVYPEWRGVSVTSGKAVLRRTLSGVDDWKKLATDTFAYNHFLQEEDGGFVATRGPVTLALEKPGVFTISVPLNDDVVGGVMQSASPMGSLMMGQYMPRGDSLKIEHEEFIFELTYEEVLPGREAYVSWQVVNLLTRSPQWRVTQLPQGFPEATTIGRAPQMVPEKFHAELKNVTDDAEVQVDRDGKKTTVRYTLVTNEPAK